MIARGPNTKGQPAALDELLDCHPGITADGATVVQPADLALTTGIVKLADGVIKGGRQYVLAVVAADGETPTPTWYARFQVVLHGDAAPTVLGEPAVPPSSGRPFTMPGTVTHTYDLYGAASTDAGTKLKAILVSLQEP